MKVNELTKSLNNKKNRLKEIDDEIVKLNQEKEKIMDTIMKGTSFVPSILADAISYLVLAKQGELYIPVMGYYTSKFSKYDCLYLVRDEKLKSNSFYFNMEQYPYYEILPICSIETSKSKNEVVDMNNQILTFSHLRKVFNIDSEMIKKYNFKCNIYYYEGYEYIIDFITYLATLQIGKNGASLTREEMLIAVSDFLNLEKDKQKTLSMEK